VEIKINKEVREYSEKVLFGLTARQFILGLAAVAVALVLYFILPLQTDLKLLICLFATAPFIVFGFARVQGHTPEEYLKRRRDRLRTPELKLGDENTYYRIYRRHKYEQRMIEMQRGKPFRRKQNRENNTKENN
jgi:hypothetical protein